jgi:hypothetical protein
LLYCLMKYFQVILLKTIDASNGLVNGSKGVVLGFSR